ncbi:MAG: glycerol transport system ATP-binding protein [Glaciecola sp.]|jgi:glycerol transport system ATP-binding protein
MLELRSVSRRVEGDVFVNDVSLRLNRGSINILLGPTLAGKTSLMRLMAGLDKPDSGEILFDGESIVGVPVQKRNLAMVYQQFINYPNLTVFENIASPLRVAKLGSAEINKRVGEASDLLALSPFLNRNPSELSGGQQQRVALARAIVKRAGLVLLDEPLANLDYKLREELRSELPSLFAELGAVLVYATTEPGEALVLGGYTACLHQGSVQQFGPTLDVFKNPVALESAKIFSDPPLNITKFESSEGICKISGEERELSFLRAKLPNGSYSLGVRPHHLYLTPTDSDDLVFKGDVSVTELSGSESFIHFDFQGQPWVALIHGIQNFKEAERVEFYVRFKNAFVFDADGIAVDIKL